MLAREGEQQTDGYQFTWIEFDLAVLGYVFHLIIDKTENLGAT